MAKYLHHSPKSINFAPHTFGVGYPKQALTPHTSHPHPHPCLHARMAELVDALVSKTSGLCPCRFDPGSGYTKRL